MKGQLVQPMGTDVSAEIVDPFKQDGFTLVEVGLQPGDISPILRGFVQAVKNRVHAT